MTLRNRKSDGARPRWKVERLHAWLQNHRRVLVRYEYHLENYLGGRLPVSPELRRGE